MIFFDKPYESFFRKFSQDSRKNFFRDYFKKSLNIPTEISSGFLQAHQEKCVPLKEFYLSFQ